MTKRPTLHFAFALSRFIQVLFTLITRVITKFVWWLLVIDITFKFRFLRDFWSRILENSGTRKSALHQNLLLWQSFWNGTQQKCAIYNLHPRLVINQSNLSYPPCSLWHWVNRCATSFQPKQGSLFRKKLTTSNQNKMNDTPPYRVNKSTWKFFEVGLYSIAIYVQVIWCDILSDGDNHSRSILKFKYWLNQTLSTYHIMVFQH